MSGHRPSRRTIGLRVAVAPLVLVALSTSTSAAAHENRLTPAPTLRAFNLVSHKPTQPDPTRWVLPVRGYHLTGRFGDVSGLWATVHTGLDFAAAEGTPIRSVATGVVTSVGYDGSYGNQTVVRLLDGTRLWYCHQSRFAVKVGDHVQPGQLLGYIGSTGNTTGPHLHLEVHPGGGKPVDPFHALRTHGLRP